MHETFMSESEDEGGDDTMLGDQSYRYLTVDEMKSLGDDSLPIDVTRDEKMDVSFVGNSMSAPPTAPEDQLSPQHQKEQQYALFTGNFQPDNVDIAKTPILAGISVNSLVSCLSAATSATTAGMWRDSKLSWRTFLVSFMVDARGGAMRGCRHSGVRVIIPPRKAAMPMRITCRYLKKDKLVHAPPLMEGEALASRILEMGPAGAKFLGPVIIEVPHFASLRGKEREIVILRSDNGETWREHTLEATEEAVQEVLNESFDGEELKQLEDLNTNRITRILTTDFPQYFAIVTRIRQEVHAIGPEGGMVSSTVVPQVQAVFPQGALTKKIKVGLQAQPIPTDLVAKLLGNRVAVSPIVTVEPRRRKFHKPITLTIPVPQAASKGMINQYSGEAPTLRLLCSITGGTTRAQWEDVTGSTPLTFVNDCVSFTTTVSARFWLMDCSNIPEATKMATELYREAIHVPFMAKFVVFSKRHQLEEARVRVFCMTDDKEDKTLEQQEQFIEVAKSRDVEVLEGKPQYLEFAGNLVPVTKSGDQLAFNFYAFRENRLPFTVRVKDQHADPVGRVAFMRQPKVGRGDPPQTPICNLNIALPDNIQPEPAPSEPDLLALEKKYSFLSIIKADTIHKADLRLSDISNMLGSDWVGLARELEITDSDINIIKSQYPDNAPQQAIVMLRLWMQTSGNKATGNILEKALRKINREDIVNQCIFNVEVVTDDSEKAMAKARLEQSGFSAKVNLDQSGFDALREELGPSRDTTLNRDVSLDVSYDEQDMMKEAESAEEEEENQRLYQDKPSHEQESRVKDLSPTYESEEKKYAGEEKVVLEDKKVEKLEDKESKPKKKEEEAIIEEKIKEEKRAGKESEEDRVPETHTIVTVETKRAPKLKDEEMEVEEMEDKSIPLVREKTEPSSTTEVKVMSQPSVAPDSSSSSTSATTIERRSVMTTDDGDGSIQEHIVVEKRTVDSTSDDLPDGGKSDILQKLGEELGRLDEQLEEKFKEKRFQREPATSEVKEEDIEEVQEEAIVAERRQDPTILTSHVIVEQGGLPSSTTTTEPASAPAPDGFTQTSVESSQIEALKAASDVTSSTTTTTHTSSTTAAGPEGEIITTTTVTTKSRSLSGEDAAAAAAAAAVQMGQGTHEEAGQQSLPGVDVEAAQPLSQEQDVGVVFTERKEYGGGVKASEETTGDQAHYPSKPTTSKPQPRSAPTSSVTPSPAPTTTTTRAEAPQEEITSARPHRRHERNLSQATNIITGPITTPEQRAAGKQDKPSIEEEQEDALPKQVEEKIKPYSERRQFWESVTTQSFDSKKSSVFKSETESDTDTGTDATVVESRVSETSHKQSSITESSDSEADVITKQKDPLFYENKGFVGAELIDVPIEERERARSPFEVSRSEAGGSVSSSQELPSPEDVAYKDVRSKRDIFEKEIKRQSMELEENQSWKRSSREIDDKVVILEQTESKVTKEMIGVDEMKVAEEKTEVVEQGAKKMERKLKEEETSKQKMKEEEKRSTKKKDEEKVEKKVKEEEKIRSKVKEETESEVRVKDVKEQFEAKAREEAEANGDRTSSVKKPSPDKAPADDKWLKREDKAPEKAKEKEEGEEKKTGKPIFSSKSVKSSTETETKEVSEIKTESSETQDNQTVKKEARERVEEICYEKKSEETTVDARLSSLDQSSQEREETEDDMTRAEETSEEEPEDLRKRPRDAKVEESVTQERRVRGDTQETVVRETRTTREGDQEQRVIKETKTQETMMADGSTVKSTSITTFTTHLDVRPEKGDGGRPRMEILTQMSSDPSSSSTEEERTFIRGHEKEGLIGGKVKSEILSEVMQSLADDISPEQKTVTTTTRVETRELTAPYETKPLASPILVPEEKMQDVVWEVSQEQSDVSLMETVQDMPFDRTHQVVDTSDQVKVDETGKIRLTEDEARKIAIEIVEEVKTEAMKRSLSAPKSSDKELEGASKRDPATLPKPSPESMFTEETSTKIEKYIQEQLSGTLDEDKRKLIESVTAKKTQMLQKRISSSDYQQHSMEITDEDLRSSGAELSPIESQMLKLRQMTEEDDTIRSAPREPSEPDESEDSVIIHDTGDDEDTFMSEYNQAKESFLLMERQRGLTKISEEEGAGEPERSSTFTVVKEIEEESERPAKTSTARDGSLSPKSGGSRKGSWMDEEELRREFRRDYEDKKKMFREEMAGKGDDVFDEGSEATQGTEVSHLMQVTETHHETRVLKQRSDDLQREAYMESSMTESMEETSAVESCRSMESKAVAEKTSIGGKEIKVVEIGTKQEEKSVQEEVHLRKKSHVDEFNRRSGTDFDTYSSSGESHYFTAAEGTSDSRAGSRPCSSDVEALMSGTPGTSEYDTALTSQDTSQYSSTSQDYRTAASSMSSRDSMKSIDSESSGHLASVELSETSETLVPTALELERDMDLLEREDMEEDGTAATRRTVIPQLTIHSGTPKSEDMPCSFELEPEEGEPEIDTAEGDDFHQSSKMKRSMEMTFHPEPKPLRPAQGGREMIASSLEESTASEVSMSTVVEQEKCQISMQESTDTNLTMSTISEQMLSSMEGQSDVEQQQVLHTESSTITTITGESQASPASVTITATSVRHPSDDSGTASMCTQVTSEPRQEDEEHKVDTEPFFRANGPTEVEYVPEYDDDQDEQKTQLAHGSRLAEAPGVPTPSQQGEGQTGAAASPSVGPEKVSIVEESYETEADQEYGPMIREEEFYDLAEAELQYSMEEQPEAEMGSMLGIDEPIERPRTPEPGIIPAATSVQMVLDSPLEPCGEYTEVDKRFSAVFSTTYSEDRDISPRAILRSSFSVDVPNITVTEHTAPTPLQFRYPDLEREEDFPECAQGYFQSDVEMPPGAVAPTVATPGSQESISSCASQKSSTTDSEQGREYCLDDEIRGPISFEDYGSFELVDVGDIGDVSEYEQTLYMHEERMREMTLIKEEDEEDLIEGDRQTSSPITIPSQLKAIKIESGSGGSASESQSGESDVIEHPEVDFDAAVDEQRRWLEMQFDDPEGTAYDYVQAGYIEHVYSGPLEDIEEEREDMEKRDLSHLVKTSSSLSSTPEYDVLAGRKFFTRSGEHDDISMSSLQEFERLEKEVAIENAARRSSSGSQESLNGKKPASKSGQGDDISIGSFSSLSEFERLESECQLVDQIEKAAKEELAMLSEIEEGHESQVSESESCETISETGKDSDEGDYDQRMFEIDEIIRQAQSNVEGFNKHHVALKSVPLKDLVCSGVSQDGTESSALDRTPSQGKDDADPDSLEEGTALDIDRDQSAGAQGSRSRSDPMSLSTDSIEAGKIAVARPPSIDSLEKANNQRTSDPMTTSVDSIEMNASRQDVMTGSTDSLEGRRRRNDVMSTSTDSMEYGRRGGDAMTTSIDSLGRDDSSGRDADISSGSERVGRSLPLDGSSIGVMEGSIDSLDPSSSQATHATYQYETDSVMSGSFTSGCSNTLMASHHEDALGHDIMTASMYLPEGELPTHVERTEERFVRYVTRDDGVATETIAPSEEPGYSHTVTRTVAMAPEIRQVTISGPEAQQRLKDYMERFDAGEHVSEEEKVDERGNVHVRRMVQHRYVIEPESTVQHGFTLSDPTTEEEVIKDEHGNTTRILRRTVVTTHTVEVDLDTGEPIHPEDAAAATFAAPSSSTATTTQKHHHHLHHHAKTLSSSSPSSSPSRSVGGPVPSSISTTTTTTSTSSPRPPGPPTRLSSSRQPPSPSPLEPNTVSDGVLYQVMSNFEETCDDSTSDPSTTQSATTHTRIISRTYGPDGEVEEHISEEFH